MAIRLRTNFERCCRLCAEEQEVTIMIFSDEAEAMLLQNKLNRYLLIEVDEDDKLPKYICINCCTKLHTVCEFIDTARKAQDILFKRSLELDQIQSGNYTIDQEMKTEPESYPDNDEKKYTEMEISVDPMMVLHNSQETLSPDTNDDYIEDVTYLHGVDSENVTIKLIRRGDKTDSTDKQNAKPFPCVTCKRGFHSELALQNHLWIHYKDDKSEKQLKCATCNEIFINKRVLIQHLRDHKDKGLCQLCGRTFRSEKTYAAHMTGHITKKSYTCKICGRSYSTWGNLKTHSVAHSNERPFGCPYCKKTFKRNQDLKFHINQHTGVKPFQCPFCDKAFASSGNCYSHRSRVHPGRGVESVIHRWGNVPRDTRPQTQTQPRPIAPKPTIVSVKGIFKYQCQLCEHSFIKQENYRYHMYKHTGEKPFNCSFCQEKFVTRKGLLLHHDKYHPTLDRPLALLTKNVLLK